MNIGICRAGLSLYSPVVGGHMVWRLHGLHCTDTVLWLCYQEIKRKPNKIRIGNGRMEKVASNSRLPEIPETQSMDLFG